MKILITGGLGYIGSHIALLLKENAIIIDNQSNSNLDYKKKLPLSKVYNQEINYKNLQKIFSEHLITGVIHLAGFKAVNISSKKPLLYYKNNIYTSLSLLECMHDFNIRKLIFSSSATVYGDLHQSPLSEDFSLMGTNPYGNTKIVIERMIKDYTNSNPKFKALSLRYFNPLGADVKAGLAEQPLGKPQNIMPVLTNAVQNRKIFKIFGNNYDTPDGTCVRDYIHVKDLANAHLIALKKLSKIDSYDAINLGLGTGISVMELIKTFETVNQVSVKYQFNSRRKGDVGICFADNSKAKKILGWQPKYAYKDMVKDSWQAVKKS